MLNIFISSLTDYNNGILTGRWHNLETETGRDEARSAVSAIYASNGEAFISDFESDHIKVDEFTPVSKLCAVGEIFEMVDMDTEVLLGDCDDGTFDHLNMQDMNDFDDVMSRYTPTEIAMKCHFGDFNPTHDFFIFNGYANLESCDRAEYAAQLKSEHRNIVRHWLDRVHGVAF